MANTPKAPVDKPLRTRSEQLPCELSPTEFMDRATALARVVADITSEDDRQSSVKAEMKAALTALEAEQARLSLIVTRRAEPRAVTVEDWPLFANGLVEVVRADTGAIIRTRPMSEDERQQCLPMK